jgi:hypothetical protein
MHPSNSHVGSAELATMSEGKLTMQLSWLPTNACWLDQLEIWFSLLQRKLLQPTHFCSLDELEQAIHDFIPRSNQTAQPLKWSSTVEQLEHKLATRLRGGVAAIGEQIAWTACAPTWNLAGGASNLCPPVLRESRVKHLSIFTWFRPDPAAFFEHVNRETGILFHWRAS